jgi:hypothetical protein
VEVDSLHLERPLIMSWNVMVWERGTRTLLSSARMALDVGGMWSGRV